MRTLRFAHPTTGPPRAAASEFLPRYSGPAPFDLLRGLEHWRGGGMDAVPRGFRDQWREPLLYCVGFSDPGHAALGRCSSFG